MSSISTTYLSELENEIGMQPNTKQAANRVIWPDIEPVTDAVKDRQLFQMAIFG